MEKLKMIKSTLKKKIKHNQKDIKGPQKTETMLSERA